MKPKATLRHYLLLAASSLLAISHSHAAAVTWDITPGAVGAGDSLVTGGAGTWNTTNGNWTTDSGVNNIAWVNANNDTAIFSGTAGTVTLGTGITVGGLTFDTAGYTVAGNTLTFGTPGNITANADATISSILAGNAITKTGTGTLVLTGANTYTGGTTISAGTLIGTGGTGGSLGSGTVTNSAVLTLNYNDQVIANVISGSGSVRTDAGAANRHVFIGSNNSYSGGTFVDVGILRILTERSGGTADLGTGTVTVANGASFEIWAPRAKTVTNNIVLNGATGNAGRPALNQDGGAGLVTLSGTVTLNATSDIGIGGGSSNSMTITGVVSGVGGMIVDERGLTGVNRTLTLSGANTYTGPTTLNAGTLKAGVASVANVSGAFGNNSAVTLANVATGATLDITGFNTQIGSLTGGGTLGGNVTLGAATLTVGGDNTSPAAYAGVISGTGGGVTKIGTGTQILSGTNTYTGGTTVNDGTLFLGSASALGTASATITGGSLNLGGQSVTNAVSIGAAGTLTGSGSTGAATLAGSVSPGGGSSGLITMASASVAPTSAIALQLAATGTRGVDYDAITVSDSLALDGTITVSLNGLTPANGQSFDIIDSTGPIDVTNFTVATDLILPALGGGLVWDTSAFVSTGVVSISAGGDPYATWAGGAVFDEDDNNDGVDNGLAWMLGAGSPTEIATGRLPTVTQTGGNLEISFTCLKIAGRGTSVLKLQYSKDLGINDAWADHEVTVPDAAGLIGSVTFTVPTVNGDPDLVDLKASIPASEAAPGTTLFGRLMAVKQP